MPYDLFISYSRRDNENGRVTQLVERISPRAIYRTLHYAATRNSCDAKALAEWLLHDGNLLLDDRSFRIVPAGLEKDTE